MVHSGMGRAVSPRSRCSTKTAMAAVWAAPRKNRATEKARSTIRPISNDACTRWAAARLGKKLTQNKNRAKAPKKKMAAFSAQMRRRCARSSILGQLLSFLCPCYSTLPGKMQVKKL